jgi:hypothetical protein
MEFVKAGITSGGVIIVQVSMIIFQVRHKLLREGKHTDMELGGSSSVNLLLRSQILMKAAIWCHCCVSYN